jgi:hypothetical protein
LVITTAGSVVIQNQILRNGLTSTPFNPGLAPIYIQHKALRLDLSPQAKSPSLLTVSDVTTLKTVVEPITTDNPGAVMMYLAMLNSPGSSVSAIGVAATSADAPEGTPTAYAECASFLEAKEVYAIATATQQSVVHQAFLAHVTFMSKSTSKGERIYFFNPVEPDRSNPILLGSGTDANTTATARQVTLDTNIAQKLIDNGIDPALAINPASGAIANEVYLDLAGDDNIYLVETVTNGDTLLLRVAFATTENTDAFYATTAPTSVISDDWTVAIRGTALLLTGTTTADKPGIATAVAGTGAGYKNRRGFMVFPDEAGINITGLEQLVPGYYSTGAIVGMVASLPPQQGFTNYPIAGLTQSPGSNDKFTETHLDTMAAGGAYILIQDATGAPILCRHQLSTDLTSIETRELSITKVVDYTAKFIRVGLRNFIGRFNITQAFIDQLSAVVQGLISFLTEGGVLIGGDVNNIVQDSSSKDTVIIDVLLDVPYPCNYIRVTLIV